MKAGVERVGGELSLESPHLRLIRVVFMPLNTMLKLGNELKSIITSATSQEAVDLCTASKETPPLRLLRLRV